MNRANLIWAGGISAILGGLWTFLFQLEDELLWPASILVLMALWLGGLLGFLAYGRSGRLGKAGLLTAASACVLLLLAISLGTWVEQLEIPWNLFMVLLLGLPLGLAIHGIALLRTRALGYGNGLPLLLGVALLGVFLNDPAWPFWIQQVLFLLLGMGWIALGYVLLTAGRDHVAPDTRSGIPRSQSMARGRLVFGGGLLLVVFFSQLVVWRSNYQVITCPAPIEGARLIPPNGPRPVIVDADMAHDDMMAILYLLQHPGVRVEAITVAGTGEAHCGPGVRNAAGLTALHGEPDIPVACGDERPMVGRHEFPSAWRAAADDLYGLSLPENPESPSTQTAADLIASVVGRSQQKVTLITLGPLTNVAQALQSNPEMVSGLEEIYIMGGAVELGGNVGLSGVGIDNPVAEWNIYIDPRAANLVIGSGAPVTLVPLNATRHAPVTPELYRCLQENHPTPEATFAYHLLRANYDFVASGGFQFWDSLTAAITTDETLATYKVMQLSVVEAEGSSSGQTRPDPAGQTVRVAIAADRARFESLFLGALSSEGVERR